MLLNEIFGARTAKASTFDGGASERVIDLIVNRSDTAQQIANKWMNTYIRVLRDGGAGENTLDRLRELRVNFHQAIAAGDWTKAALKYKQAVGIFNGTMARMNKEAEDEVRREYDNDDYDVFPPFD